MRQPLGAGVPEVGFGPESFESSATALVARASGFPAIVHLKNVRADRCGAVDLIQEKLFGNFRFARSIAPGVGEKHPVAAGKIGMQLALILMQRRRSPRGAA